MEVGRPGTFNVQVQHPSGKVLAFPDDLRPPRSAQALGEAGGKAFAVTPISPAQQALDGPQVAWSWALVPDRIGQQPVELSVDVRWEDSAGREVSRRRLLDQLLEIPVEKPFISTTWLYILAAVLGALGIALTALWAIGQVLGLWPGGGRQTGHGPTGSTVRKVKEPRR